MQELWYQNTTAHNKKWMLMHGIKKIEEAALMACTPIHHTITLYEDILKKGFAYTYKTE